MPFEHRGWREAQVTKLQEDRLLALAVLFGRDDCGLPEGGSVFQLAEPDIAKADRIVVVLQHDGAFVAVRFVFGDGVRPKPACAALKCDMVLHQDAVVQDGEIRLTCDPAGIIEDRPMEDDIISLPLTGLAAGIHQRNRPAVQRSTLTVRVGFVFIRVEDLDFIGSLEEHAAIAASLAGACNLGGRGELHMQLA